MRILSIAPSRLSFFGGGTDTPYYAKEYGGAVINMAINIRQHTTLYSEDDIFGVQNRFPPQATPDFYYDIFKHYKIDGVHHTKIISEFDGFIKSGLGSSGAAGVSVIGAINKLLNLGMSRYDIAQEAWQHEIDFGIYTGKQDQFASVYGGLNYMRFTDKVDVVKLSVPDFDEFLSWISVFYIGQGEKDYRVQEKFKQLTAKKLRSLDILKYITGLALPLFQLGRYDEIAELLNLTWHYKKESSNVTNAKIDKIYSEALKAGAIGGKICGSGLGGYMVFLCPPQKREIFIKKMNDIHIEDVDFTIDTQGLEARIL